MRYYPRNSFVKLIINLSRYAVLASLLAMTSLPTMADDRTYYRWSDERGNPVHSDRPPPEGTDYEVVSTGSSRVRKVDAEEGAVPAETKSVPGNEFDTFETAKAETPKKNSEYCARAQDNLNTLNSAARIRIRDSEGDFTYLTTEEKAEEKAKALDLIAAHCE